MSKVSARFTEKDLTSFYEKHGRAALNELATKIGADPEYLWQCAAVSAKTGKPRRRLGTELCKKLAAAPGYSFELEKLREDIYGAPRGRRRRAAAVEATA